MALLKVKNVGLCSNSLEMFQFVFALLAVRHSRNRKTIHFPVATTQPGREDVFQKVSFLCSSTPQDIWRIEKLPGHSEYVFDESSYPVQGRARFGHNKNDTCIHGPEKSRGRKL